MAGKAFKVPMPASYGNLTEAKLVQKGTDLWVQLPTNLVQDHRMIRKSVYTQDYSKGLRGPHKFRNVKAKVVTRRGTNPRLLEDFSSFQGDSVPQHRTKDCMDLTTAFGANLSAHGRKRACRSPSRSFEDINSRSRYDSMKSRHNEPITALLPVMCDPEMGMNHHYSSPSILTGRMSAGKSYNDKAREALPGLGKWQDSGDTDGLQPTIPTNHSAGIDGDDFLENPLRRPDLVNYDHKRSVSIRTPVHRAHSSSQHYGALGRRLEEGQALLDNAGCTINLDPPTYDNSAKRHELEVLTKVNHGGTHHLDSNISLGHLYQPLDYSTKAGYTVVGENYSHTNATFSNTSSDNRGSFNIAPDWVSERKKSVVIHH